MPVDRRPSSGKRKAPARPKAGPPTPKPQDTKSAKEFKRATQHKKSPVYRAAVKNAYEAAPEPRKAQMRKVAQKKNTVEAKVIKSHAKKLGHEAKDTKGAADKRRGQVVSQREIKQARLRYLKRTNKGVDLGAVFKLGLTAGRPMGESGKRVPGAAAVGPGELVASRTGVGMLGKMPAGVARAFVQAPGKTSVNTAKGFRDMAVGLPAALVSTAADTVKGTAEGDPLRGVRNQAKLAGKDYSRRYGPLTKPGFSGVKEFSERVKKEGAAGEIVDVAALTTGTAGAVGRGLGTSAKKGRLGDRAKTVMTEPRKKVRVGGTSRDQEIDRNIIKAAAQKKKDKVRENRAKKKVARVEGTDRKLPLNIVEAVTRGEVTPLRQGRAERKVVKEVARDKGRALVRMKREQAREVGQGAVQDLAKLNKHERQAFKYSMQLGLPADASKARALLERRRDQIVQARAEEGTEIPRVLRKTNDELAVIDDLLANSSKAFTPRLRETVKKQQVRERRVADRDPGLDPVQAQLRRYAPQAAYLGVKRQEGETNGQFLRRVKKAAKDAEVERPGYIKSEKRPASVFSHFALGGAKTVAGENKKWKGDLFRTGREDVRPEVFTTGLARGIKRKHNWNHVADRFEQHSIEWSRNKNIEELRKELDERGIDARTVAFWNPKRFRDEQKQKTDAVEGDNEKEAFGDEPTAEGLSDAVTLAAVKADGTIPSQFKETTGWSIVPRSVYDEIHADTRPSGAFGRSLDIVKGKQARLMLGTSPGWLQYQVASNALLTGLAGTGPVDVVKANLWWKKLSDAERDAIEPYIGIGAFKDVTDQTKLGAASDASVVNAYRALKATPFMQRISRGNPLDMLFRFDNAQNNVFRRSVMYSQMKRDAYKRMGENATAMAKTQERLVNILKLGPEEKMRELAKNPELLEKYATHVNDFLGDYTTYTAKQRRYFARNVMFFGFLRYSLRFAFYVMPVKHPIMASVIGQMGRMQTEETRKLLGGDDLPWALGKMYWSSDGKLKSVDMSRMNPAMNSLTGIRNPSQIAGFLPPMFGAAFDQMSSKLNFKDRALRVEGETQGRKAGEYGLGDRATVFLDSMLSIMTPYRAAEKMTQSGPQGDDSTLLRNKPTLYVDQKLLAKIAQGEKDKAKGSEILKQQFLPLLPSNSKDPEIAEFLREQREEREKAREKQHQRRTGRRKGSFDYGSAKSSGSTSVKGGGFDYSTAKPSK